MTGTKNSERAPAAFGTPTSSHADSQEWLQTRPGERTWISVPAKETNGAYSVVEIQSSPGDSTPMHVHQNEDEHFVIVEGTARIALGDAIFDAAAGTSITLPRNIPHAWGNASDSPLRMVVICTPGGVEEALRLIAQGGKDIDFLAIAKKSGVQILGPFLLDAQRGATSKESKR
jgi:mannose-6-phosphate isomerase-like protein (cupin superfamily)